MSKKNTFLFFIHITKTGGSSFKQLLERNLKGQLDQIYCPIWEAPFTSEQLTSYLKEYSGKKAMTSHRICIDVPFDFEERDVRAVAFVRDPASRFLSHYFFHRNNNMPGYDEVKTMSASQYAEYALKEGNEDWLIDGQFKFLMRSNPNGSINDIQSLVNTGKLLLLPLNRFDDSCLILEKELPEIIHNAAYVRQNISIRDQKPAKEVLDNISSYMDLDNQLVEIANGCLDGYLKKHYPSEHEISAAHTNFKSRCKRLKLFYWIPRKTAGKILRFLKILSWEFHLDPQTKETLQRFDCSHKETYRQNAIFMPTYNDINQVSHNSYKLKLIAWSIINMKTLFIREKFPWMGEHSGYDRLFHYLSNDLMNSSNSIFRSNYPFALGDDWIIIIKFAGRVAE